MKQSLKTGKEIIRLGIDLSEDEFIEVVSLASNDNPFDQLYANLDIDRRRVDKIEKLTNKDLTKQYNDMIRELKKDISDMREYLLTPGTQPLQSELLEFFQNQQLLSTIQLRVDQLQSNSADIITNGIIQAGQIGYESFRKDFEIMSRLHAISREEVERMMQFNTPNLVASELTIPLAVGDTRRLATFTMNRIIEILREETLKGSSFKEIIKRLDDISDLPLHRARLISRWAVIKGFQQERLSLFKQSKLSNIKKMWVGKLDNRICPYCLALHGTVVDSLDKDFDHSAGYARKELKVYMGLEHPPRHAQCRCGIVLWREEWRESSIYSPELLQVKAFNKAKELGYYVK